MMLAQPVSPWTSRGPAVGPETMFYGLGAETFPRRYMYDQSCLYGTTTMSGMHYGLVAAGLFLGFAVGALTFARSPRHARARR